MSKTLEECKESIKEQNEREYNTNYTDCEYCFSGKPTIYLSVEGRTGLHHICQECDEDRLAKIMLAQENKTTIKDIANNHWFFAFLHGAALVAWVPLTWAVSGNILLHYLGDSQYIWEYQWGFAATGVLFNGYQMVQRMRKAGMTLG